MFVRTLLPTQKTVFAKLFDYCSSRYKAIHAVKLGACSGHDSVFVHDDNHRDVVAKPHFKVVRVMRCCDLNCTGTKLWINKLICDDRDQSIDVRKSNRLTNHMFVAIIVWIDCNSTVTKHRLRARCCDKDMVTVEISVANLDKFTIDLLVIDFNVRKCSSASCAPVDNALCSIDQTLFI